MIAILPLNFRILPSLPWTLLPLGVALWAYWSYFGGRGWPRSTKDARNELRRSNPIAPGVRPTVVVAGSLFASSVFVIAILQYALREMPPEAFGLVTSLANLPLWSAVPLALGAAFFVGVTEEMSYRGYMQVPIERRHGPILGLTLPALVFALSHGIDLMVLPVFLFVSIGWSFIAWRVDSIRPGIVLHTIVDATAFLWVIFRPEDVSRLAATSLVEQGLTPGYRVLAGIALVLVVATIAAFVMLHRRTGGSEIGDTSSALEARSSA
jgi:membrane protease YdiL (CAAX protease family)